jgi:hypothetical protein
MRGRGRIIGLALAVVAAGLVAVPGGVARAADVDTFHGQSPQRVLDTRPSGPTVDGSASGIGAVPAGGTINVPVISRGGVPATGVGAVALNVTVTGATGPGYLTVWPRGAAQPTASNLNFVAGQTVPNMVIVKVGAGGEASFFNGGSGSVHVIADVLGWFPTGMSYTGLTPARLMDTRLGAPTVDGESAAIGAAAAGATLDVRVAGRGGVPGGAAAVALNVTATNPTAAGYLTVWPKGAARPTASSLNFVAGQTVPNMVIVPVGADGQVSLFNGATGTADLIVDVLGWFPAGASFTGLTPARLMDTRAGGPTIDTRFAGGSQVFESSTYNLVIAGRGGVPAGAGAVALNVTVTNPNRPGYLTIHPQGAVRPTASNLNFEAGQTVANMVLVPLGGSGQISIHLTDGQPNEFLDAEASVIVDVLGWFPNPTDPPTMYGNNLVLRSNGIGGAVLGDTPAGVLGVISPVLGAPTSSTDEAFPEARTDSYFNPETYHGFAHPYGREVCWGGDNFCATFGGPNAATLTFVGWFYFDSVNGKLIDTNGLGMGSRGSNFPGAIPTIPTGGCYSSSIGEAASGIGLGLVSDGQWFGVPDEEGNVDYFQPPQSDVFVQSMFVGEAIFSTEGDC